VEVGARYPEHKMLAVINTVNGIWSGSQVALASVANAWPLDRLFLPVSVGGQDSIRVSRHHFSDDNTSSMRKIAVINKNRLTNSIRCDTIYRCSLQCVS
jgi:hypothetical protein